MTDPMEAFIHGYPIAYASSWWIWLVPIKSMEIFRSCFESKSLHLAGVLLLLMWVWLLFLFLFTLTFSTCLRPKTDFMHRFASLIFPWFCFCLGVFKIDVEDHTAHSSWWITNIPAILCSSCCLSDPRYGLREWLHFSAQPLCPCLRVQAHQPSTVELLPNHRIMYTMVCV